MDNQTNNDKSAEAVASGGSSVACDCGGSPHGDHCAAVEAGIETSEWRCEECGQHEGNCHHRQPNSPEQ